MLRFSSCTVALWMYSPGLSPLSHLCPHPRSNFVPLPVDRSTVRTVDVQFTLFTIATWARAVKYHYGGWMAGLAGHIVRFGVVLARMQKLFAPFIHRYTYTYWLPAISGKCLPFGQPASICEAESESERDRVEQGDGELPNEVSYLSCCSQFFCCCCGGDALRPLRV